MRGLDLDAQLTERHEAQHGDTTGQGEAQPCRHERKCERTLAQPLRRYGQHIIRVNGDSNEAKHPKYAGHNPLPRLSEPTPYLSSRLAVRRRADADLRGVKRRALIAAWLHIGEGLAVYVWCLTGLWSARRQEVHNLCVLCARGNGCAAGGGARGNAWLCLCYAEGTTVVHAVLRW